MVGKAKQVSSVHGFGSTKEMICSKITDILKWSKLTNVCVYMCFIFAYICVHMCLCIYYVCLHSCVWVWVHIWILECWVRCWFSPTHYLSLYFFTASSRQECWSLTSTASCLSLISHRSPHLGYVSGFSHELWGVRNRISKLYKYYSPRAISSAPW